MQSAFTQLLSQSKMLLTNFLLLLKVPALPEDGWSFMIAA